MEPLSVQWWPVADCISGPSSAPSLHPHHLALAVHETLAGGTEEDM